MIFLLTIMINCSLINILFTVREVPDENSFCTIEYVLPLKYNVSGTCYTGPITCHDLVLLTCPHDRFHDDSAYLCPQQVLNLITAANLLGLPWTLLLFSSYSQNSI